MGAKVTVRRLGELTPAARAVLGSTLDALLEADLQAGRSELWELEGGASYAVTRLEAAPANELVVCAYAGRAVREFAELVYSSAQRQGVQSIRWHTRRSGLARMLRAYAPELAEYVYRVRVAE